MRFGKIMVLGAFLYASVANAQDVMVDLSVLDDLEVPEVVVSQPLFPVLPKKVNVEVNKTVKKEKAKSVKKNVKKAEANKKPLKETVAQVKPLDDDIVVVDVEPVVEPVQSNVVIETKAAEVHENTTKEEVEKLYLPLS